MRTPLAIAIIVLLTAVAQANPGPAPELKLSSSASDYAIATDPLGAMLESDYFKAPQATLAGGKICRLRFDFLGNERLFATCR